MLRRLFVYTYNLKAATIATKTEIIISEALTTCLRDIRDAISLVTSSKRRLLLAIPALTL